MLTYISKDGILTLRTVLMKRIFNYQLTKESVMKKQERDAFVEKVASIDGVDISSVRWYDNKLTTTVTTYVGSQPVFEVRFFYINNSCFKCIEEYNNSVKST